MNDGDNNTAGFSVSGRLTALWASIIAPQGAAERTGDNGGDREASPPPVPVVWLLGKVQSGKSSIVRALSGSTAADVGSGFRPCTRTAQVYDYPECAPVIRFLDTRGLGEVSYNPGEDIAFAEGCAHLLLVVMRALDHSQDAILSVVKEVRRRRPEWPIVVAQTTLHEAYLPGADHCLPYPFDAGVVDASKPGEPKIPYDLVRSLAHQRGLFTDVPGSGPLEFVPIDFTRDGDGYHPRDYGLDALEGALSRAAPAALAAALRAAAQASVDPFSAAAHPHILGYALAAGAADVVPVAGAVAVPGLQAKLLHSLGAIYDVTWDRQTLIEFGGCLGTSVVTRLLASFGIRQVAKLVPGYGQTVGAAAAAVTSFTTTYALGKAACYFLARRKTGQVDAAAVARTYAQSLDAALRMAKDRSAGTIGPDPTDKR